MPAALALGIHSHSEGQELLPQLDHACHMWEHQGVALQVPTGHPRNLVSMASVAVARPRTSTLCPLGAAGLVSECRFPALAGVPVRLSPEVQMNPRTGVGRDVTSQEPQFRDFIKDLSPPDPLRSHRAPRDLSRRLVKHTTLLQTLKHLLFKYFPHFSN